MIDFHHISKIYMIPGYTDLRKGIDGYARLIQDHMHLDPFSDSLFIFCNRDRNKIKCIYWDKTGFWLLYKRLEKGHFKWKTNANNEIEITTTQLQWLLSGLKIDSKTSIKESNPKYV